MTGSAEPSQAAGRPVAFGVSSGVGIAAILFLSFLHCGAFDPLTAILPIVTIGAFVPGFTIGVLCREQGPGLAVIASVLFALAAMGLHPWLWFGLPIAILVTPVAVAIAAFGAFIGRAVMRRVNAEL